MIYEKPKNEIFASDAKDGEIVEFPNVKRGWGVTENLGFIPPMEYFNAAFNRVDKSLAYQLQRGVGEWDKDLEYPIGAIVSLNGIVYVAKSQNTNKNPSENKGIWHVIASEEWCKQTCLNKGDYGLGGLNNMPILQNIDDTTTPTGFYRAVENQTSGTFPKPYGGSKHAHVIVERVDVNWIKQTIVQISQDGTKPIFYRTNNLNRGWHPWKEVVTADDNTLVRRDANGDFAGRYISAGHFRLTTQQQNNLFHNGCDLLFRTSSADDQNYVRGVNANYAATMMGVIGIGQSWQNVTAQRASNVTYTNTTGRPIQVFIQSHNLHQSGSFVINGIPFQFAFGGDLYQAGQNVSFIVPAGNTYSVDLPFSMWLELR